jgi:hypothetical protein
MIRTQVFLTEDQLEALRNRAFTGGITCSQAIRDLIENELLSEKQPHKKKNVGDVLYGMFQEAQALNVQGASDLSKKMDTYLYGEDVL